MSDIEDIRRQKRERLQEQASGADQSGESAQSGTAPDEPIHIENGDHLETVTEKYDAVLADFYADWCGPCKQLAPIVEQVAAATDGAVAKVDIDAHQRLAQQYQVRGVPTMVLFADGEPVERIVGVRGGDQLASLIEQHT